MRMFKIVVFALGSIHSMSFAQSGLPASARRTYMQNFKDMALSSCISKAYSSSKDASSDAAASAGGFNEWTRYDAEGATGKLPALITKYLSKHYGSFQGKSIRLDLMKCIDMYRGPELKNLALRYVENPTHTYARDSRKSP